MANNDKGNPPAPLGPQVVKKLLDLLSTDDDFRQLFESDVDAALAQAGYRPSAASTSRAGMDESSEPTAASCLQMQAGTSLASKESIMEDRAKLEKALNAVQHFTCPPELYS